MRPITSMSALEEWIERLGFLPFFKNEIPGFSIEEHTPASHWFSDERDGPWEWKGPVIRQLGCAYGKFFGGKAGYVSQKWFGELANWRRNGYDFDARYDDGLACFKDKQLWQTIREHDRPMLTKQLKAACGYGKEGQKGFETVMTRLQMQTYVTVADFEYLVDKNGKPYGWGVARYTVPERQFGDAFLQSAYAAAPEESAGRLLAHLERVLPHAGKAQLLRVLRR